MYVVEEMDPVMNWYLKYFFLNSKVDPLAPNYNCKIYIQISQFFNKFNKFFNVIFAEMTY